MFKLSILGLTLAALASTTHAACIDQNIKLQVLGSGGPELDDGRASTSYLIWMDGKARVLVDAGGGSSANFEKSGANVNNLQAVLFSHYHVDHSGDFSAYVKASFFTPREENLPVFGPDRNDRMPSTTEFLNTLLGNQGVYRYLSSYVEADKPSEFKLIPHDVALDATQAKKFQVNEAVAVSAIPVHHGPIAAVAWRVNMGQCSISFSGDMNNQTGHLSTLAKGSDLLVAHNAIPESARGVARKLHMPPSEIGKVAAQAKVSKLLISHRMKRTSGEEQEMATRAEIGKLYKGSVVFANDLDIFNIE
jgi:ribonuclease BN (tRNA processing enzyme)